jgi:hypothetical protein
VQAAGDLHHPVGNACFGQAQHIFDNPTPLDAGDDMLDHDAGAGADPIEQLLSYAQLFAFGLFF